MKNITLIEWIVIGVIAITLWAMGYGTYKKIASSPKNPVKIVSETKTDRLNNYGIQTIEHDGHWFVILSESQKGGIIHHPSCPKCFGVEKK